MKEWCKVFKKGACLSRELPFPRTPLHAESSINAWGTRWLHLGSFLSSKESGEEVPEGKGRRHQTVKKSLIPPGSDLSLFLAKIQEFQPS